MKRYIIFIIFILLSHYPLLGQILGDTRATVKEIQNYNPCESTKKTLIFCPNEKDKIVYDFNSRNYLYQISKFTYVSSVVKLREMLELKVKEYKKKYNANPIEGKGNYIFYITDSHSISFSIEHINNDYYFQEIEFNYGIYND